MKNAIVALSMMLVALTAGTALAQRSASTKALGTAYDMWSSGVYLNQALDHSRVMRSYAAASDQVPRVLAQRHSAEVRSSLANAKKSYDSLAVAHKDDETAAQHLAALNGHHADALAAMDKIDAATADGDGKGKAVGRHCTAAVRALRYAKTEHKKLMKHLKVDNPATRGKGKGGQGKRKAKAAESE